MIRLFVAVELPAELRQRIRLPIVRHRAALECTYEVLMGAGDAYIRGVTS